MYKLLLVSDQPEVLGAFEAVDNWEKLGFRAPHIRHDYEGALESMSVHHADGISVSLNNAEEEERLLAWLRNNKPCLPVFQAGRNSAEVLRYVSELGILLNRIHADFSDDRIGLPDMLQMCRHEFFRKLVSGEVHRQEDLVRNLRLMCSKMDPDHPCVIVKLTQPEENGKLAGHWLFGPDKLEYLLRQMFGKESDGLRIVPAVLQDGDVVLLYCPNLGTEHAAEDSSMTDMVTSHTDECIVHAKEYLGVDLTVQGVNVMPSLRALCNQA